MRSPSKSRPGMQWCRGGVTNPRPRTAGTRGADTMAPPCWIVMDTDGDRWMRVRLWGNSGGTVRHAQTD